jgi:hypothetical protein
MFFNLSGLQDNHSGCLSVLTFVLSLWQTASQTTEIGTAAYAFNLSELSLGKGRLLENQARTLTYLKFVDTDRLLYNFRPTHQLDTNGASSNGGWDARISPSALMFKGTS